MGIEGVLSPSLFPVYEGAGSELAWPDGLAALFWGKGKCIPVSWHAAAGFNCPWKGQRVKSSKEIDLWVILAPWTRNHLAHPPDVYRHRLPLEVT